MLVVTESQIILRTNVLVVNLTNNLAAATPEGITLRRTVPRGIDLSASIVHHPAFELRR